MRWPVNRRQMLLGSGLLLMHGPALAAREPLRIPQGAGLLPPEWTSAEAIRLWSDLPPGAAAAPPIPSAKFDPTFITGVAQPNENDFAKIDPKNVKL